MLRASAWIAVFLACGASFAFGALVGAAFMAAATTGGKAGPR